MSTDKRDYILPPQFLRVIFRDDSPMVYAEDSPSYRSVAIELTEQQRRALALKHTHSVGDEDFFERISRALLDEE